MPRRGDDFAARGYVPRCGDVVHLDWAPSAGREMQGPHYGLVLSSSLFNAATGLAAVCPITSRTGKRSGVEFAVEAGRVRGAAILSQLRMLDYQTRSLQFEAALAGAAIAEANRRVQMIFPSDFTPSPETR